jgi:hypothetical protein
MINHRYFREDFAITWPKQVIQLVSWPKAMQKNLFGA